MSDKPLVSFIMGVYNTKSFDDLKRSMENMLGQTYGNIEVVVCDDCSTNGAYEFLVENYGDNESVSILRNEVNSGAGVARNYALSCAKGEYIAIQDDDDYSDVTRIEKQVDFLEKNQEFGFVSSGLSKFDEFGVWSSIILKQQPSKRDFRIYSQHVHAATLFRVGILKSAGGYRIAKETAHGEDYDLFMRLYANGVRGYNLQEILYYYNLKRDFSRRIKYRYKWNEAKIRFKGFSAMRLPLIDFVYVARPLIAGLIPERIKSKIKKK